MNKEKQKTKEEEFSSLGDFIRHEREAQHMTLAALAEKTGISASYINRIERNLRKTPSIKIIGRISEALNVPVSSFLSSSNQDSSQKPPTLAQLLYANDFSVKKGRPAVSGDEKNLLIELYEFIGSMDWEKNKHKELAKLLKYIDSYYDLKQKK